MNTPNYNFAMSVLYRTSRTMWDNCKKFITEMKQFKNFYDAGYCDARIAEIDEAEALKSDAARSAEHETLRVELVTLAATCRDKWQALKMYIMTAFASNPELRTINYNAAGWAHYDSAGNDSWTSVTALCQEGGLYITENMTVLTANENMPATFETDFDNAATAFNTKLALFYQAEEDARVGTEEKIEANNAIYNSIVNLSFDGQYVFRNDEAKRRQFSIEAVSELVEPAGSSSAVLTVFNSETEMPIALATIQVVGSSKNTVTDTTGRGEINQLPAEETHFMISADGMTDKEVVLTLTTGTTSRATVMMTPILTGEMVAGPQPVVQPGVPA